MSIAINFGLCRSRKVFVVCLHRNVSRETRDAANCEQVCIFFSSQRLRICLGKQLKFPKHGTRRNELLGTKSRGNCDKHCNSTTPSTFPISSSLSKRDRFFPFRCVSCRRWDLNPLLRLAAEFSSAKKSDYEIDIFDQLSFDCNEFLITSMWAPKMIR